MMRYLMLLLFIFPVSQAFAQDRRDIAPVSGIVGFRWDPTRASPDLLLPNGPVPVPVGKTEYYRVCAKASDGWRLVRGSVRITPRHGARDGAGCFVLCPEEENNDGAGFDKSPVTAAQCVGQELEGSICFLFRMSVNKGQTCEFNPYEITGEETRR
jgi:hypothetical protein